jgi:N-acetylglucosaminyldiphosphoundecaprenol N-acetyl-beta-D-mannosaminyltransferase
MNSILQEIKKSHILNVEIHNVTMEETLSILKEMALSGKAHHVMTVNPEFVMIAKENEQFKSVMANASLKLADGIGIILAARILGEPLKERVAGIDTVLHLARVAQENNLRMFLLGAAPGVAEKTATILEKNNPGLKIVGTYSGSPRIEEEETICSMIEKVQPHILLVAYGPPKQDLWIARTMNRLKIPIAIGVGGTFDFIAGEAKRAPKWMRRFGLEWFHRLLREPWRWRRMMTLPRFALSVFYSKLTHAPSKASL